MTTTVLEKPAAAVSKSDKVKAKEGKAARAALDAMQDNVAAPKSKKKGTAPVAGVSKADVKAAIAANVEVIKAKATALPPLAKVIKKKAAAPVKAKPAPKPVEPKPRKVSAMWVIRTNMAEALATNGKPATVEMISKACSDAGVPKSNATIQTIISDFMQSYLAMRQAGLVKA
jgi:hypothetical protein